MNPDQQSPDDDEALDPRAAMELVTTQQLEISRRLAAGVPVILAAWGVAWVVGFGMLWLIDGLAPAFRMPLVLAIVVFVVLMAAALAVSGIAGARMGRGIRTSPAAAWTGTFYGLTWVVSFLAVLALGAALRVNGMPPDLANIYYPSATTLLVGILYFVAGAIWQNWQSLVIGGWIVLVACVAPFFGHPANYLVFALAGGGVFVVGAVVAAIWVHRGGGGSTAGSR